MTLTWPAVSYFQAPSKPLEPEGHGSDGDSPDRARWVLALGVVSLLIGPLGVFAWMAGNACLAAIAEGRLDPTCESNAKAGRLLGIIALGLFTFKVTVLAPLALVLWYA